MTSAVNVTSQTLLARNRIQDYEKAQPEFGNAAGATLVTTFAGALCSDPTSRVSLSEKEFWNEQSIE